MPGERVILLGGVTSHRVLATILTARASKLARSWPAVTLLDDPHDPALTPTRSALTSALVERERRRMNESPTLGADGIASRVLAYDVADPGVTPHPAHEPIPLRPFRWAGAWPLRTERDAYEFSAWKRRRMIGRIANEAASTTP